jgi:hypothetical protein
MNRKMTLFALAGSPGDFGMSGLAAVVDAAAVRAKKPSSDKNEVSAAAPNPQPVSHRNSRRVRPQKSRTGFLEGMMGSDESLNR